MVELVDTLVLETSLMRVQVQVLSGAPYEREGVYMYYIITVRHDDYRCIGCYKSPSLAYRAIERNACDMFEDGYYRYAFVQWIDTGLYPDMKEQQWYAYDYITKEIKKCNRPKDIQQQFYIIG